MITAVPLQILIVWPLSRIRVKMQGATVVSGEEFAVGDERELIEELSVFARRVL